MSLILGIETSTKICSVALYDGEKLLALEEEGGEYSHSEKLTVFIQRVLEKTNIQLKDIAAIAVSKGPGSYTGLRIGVSVAKGLCYALDKPLISVDTLQGMALNIATVFPESDTLYAPMIDARRMEVYTAFYDVKNKSVTPVSAEIIDENSFSEALKVQKLLFFGDGSSKCAEVLSNQENATFLDIGLPSAEFIGNIAYKKLKKQDFEDVAYFEPYYLKDFVGTTPKKLL